MVEYQVSEDFQNVDDDVDYESSTTEVVNIHNLDEHRRQKEEVDLQGLEQSLQSRVNIESMSARELATLWAKKFQEVFGFEYKFELPRDHAIFKGFLGKFGPESGLMILHLFDEWDGRGSGEVANVVMLSKTGWSWLTDKLYAEVQLKKQPKRRVASRSGVFLDGDRFLELFGQ